MIIIPTMHCTSTNKARAIFLYSFFRQIRFKTEKNHFKIILSKKCLKVATEALAALRKKFLSQNFTTLVAPQSKEDTASW